MAGCGGVFGPNRGISAGRTALSERCWLTSIEEKIKLTETTKGRGPAVPGRALSVAGGNPW